eukprot:3487488-Rhodomonas_salina.1
MRRFLESTAHNVVSLAQARPPDPFLSFLFPACACLLARSTSSCVVLGVPCAECRWARLSLGRAQVC